MGQAENMGQLYLGLSFIMSLAMAAISPGPLRLKPTKAHVYFSTGALIGGGAKSLSPLKELKFRYSSKSGVERWILLFDGSSPDERPYFHLALRGDIRELKLTLSQSSGDLDRTRSMMEKLRSSEFAAETQVQVFEPEGRVVLIMKLKHDVEIEAYGGLGAAVQLDLRRVKR